MANVKFLITLISIFFSATAAVLDIPPPSSIAAVLFTLGFHELSTVAAMANISAASRITTFDSSLASCPSCPLPLLLREQSPLLHKSASAATIRTPSHLSDTTSTALSEISPPPQTVAPALEVVFSFDFLAGLIAAAALVSVMCNSVGIVPGYVGGDDNPPPPEENPAAAAPDEEEEEEEVSDMDDEEFAEFTQMLNDWVQDLEVRDFLIEWADLLGIDPTII